VVERSGALHDRKRLVGRLLQLDELDRQKRIREKIKKVEGTCALRWFALWTVGRLARMPIRRESSG